MRTDSAVFSTLLESGLPGTKKCWPKGGAPALPWFTYELEDDGVLMADDSNYENLPVYRASLYEEATGESSDALEKVISEKFGPHTREEYWLEDEKCWMTTYTFTYTGGQSDG